MSKEITFKCFICNKEYKIDAWKNTMDGKKCSCGGALILKREKLKKNDITVTLDLDADEAKAKLNDIEQQLDRILKKQDKMQNKPMPRTDGIDSNSRELLLRIDTDCGRIVRMLLGKSTKDMDKVVEKYDEKIRPMQGLVVKDLHTRSDMEHLIDMIMETVVDSSLHIGDKVYVCGSGTMRELAK